MIAQIIRTEADRVIACTRISEIDLSTVKKMIITDAKPDRSNAQNALSHKWYAEIGRHTGHGTEDERCYCKLHIGVPILRAEEPDFRETYDSTVKGLQYEQKLELMRIIPVTRLMKVKQM